MFLLFSYLGERNLDKSDNYKFGTNMDFSFKKYEFIKYWSIKNPYLTPFPLDLKGQSILLIYSGKIVILSFRL